MPEPTLKSRLEHLEDMSAQDTESIRLIHSKIEATDRVLADRFSALNEQLGSRFKGINERFEGLEYTPPPPDRSELYTALAAAQLEIRNAEQNVDNEFLKSRYADLASVMDSVKEPLAKNGLTIIQLTATREEVKTVDETPGAIGIKTILAHISGQCIVDITAMYPPKQDPQGIGSCRTYMRRYAVLAICAIAGAIDDDAEGTKKDPNDYDKITPEEIDAILALADELFKEKADFVIQQMVEKTFNITHVSNIKAGEADLAIKRLKNTSRREKQAAKRGNKDKVSPKPPEAKGDGVTDDTAALQATVEDREPGEDG